MNKKIEDVLDRLKDLDGELYGVMTYFNFYIATDLYLQPTISSTHLNLPTNPKDTLTRDIEFLESNIKHVPHNLLDDYKFLIKYMEGLQVARKLI